MVQGIFADDVFPLKLWEHLHENVQQFLKAHLQKLQGQQDTIGIDPRLAFRRFEGTQEGAAFPGGKYKRSSAQAPCLQEYFFFIEQLLHFR